MLCLCHGNHSTETKAAHTGQTTTLTACNDIFPLPFLRGLDNPSRPRPCCTLACRCGRGPTQGTCKRELTAEGLLPSMRIWMRIIFVFKVIHAPCFHFFLSLGDTAQSRSSPNQGDGYDAHCLQRHITSQPRSLAAYCICLTASLDSNAM